MQYDDELEALALATLLYSGCGVGERKSLKNESDVRLREPRWGHLVGGSGVTGGVNVSRSTFARR